MGTLDKKFWGRENLIRGWNYFRDRIMGDRVFNKTLIADQHWLVYTGEISLDDYQNTAPLPDESLYTIQKKLDSVHDQLAKQGITFLVVIPPNKNTIYPEFMPQEVPVVGVQSRLDQVIAYQKAHGKTQILDLRPALFAARKEHLVYSYTDTHWNPFGAWIGYREILNALRKDYPNLEAHPLEDYAYVPLGMQSGDIARNLGQLAVEEEQYQLVLKTQKPVDKWVSTMGRISILTTSQPGSSLPRLVMYRDSFTDNLAPFLSDNFSRAVYVSSISIDLRFIEAEKPDIVIYEATERLLTDLFLVQ